MSSAAVSNRTEPSIPFANRSEAGRALARALERYRHWPEVAVLALPRGGVPVASEVASELGVPLDVFLVRRLGVPGREELALGAIASGGVALVDRARVGRLGLPEALVTDVLAAEVRELERRERSYRAALAPLDLSGRTLLVVDDGIATGDSMRAAVRALRHRSPARIVAAVPVASVDGTAALAREVDELVCLATPEPFRRICQWYRDFPSASEDQVRELLERAAHLRDLR